jgi:Xaa-Pro dipeptidase
MTASRLDNLRKVLTQASLNAVALNPGPTLTYLTGVRFHLMERPVVLIVDRDGDPVLILPELEMPKVGLFPYTVKAFAYGEDPSGWEAVFRKAVRSLALDNGKLGVELRQMRLLEFRYVQAAAPEAEFPDASEALAALRLNKDEAELRAMRRAVMIAQDALGSILPSIKIGQTERQIAGVLSMELLRHGSDSELPFAPIVSGGPNSANPHASPSERPLQRGDLLLVDWGATSDGYISDLTRTFAVGEVDREMQTIAGIVLAANEAGRAAGGPGAACSRVDKAARDTIEKAGYGAHFTHRTGHGIGMESHEEPYMRSDNTKVLAPGMTYTVEPGIYLPDRGGVRIEDDVVVTQDGVDVLSDMPRELAVVG